MKISKDIYDACLRGNRDGQEQLYKIVYCDMMRIVLRYTHQEADAMDVLNRALLKVFMKISEFKGDHINLGGWIKRIVVNESIDFYRSNKKSTPMNGIDSKVENQISVDLEEDPGYLLILLNRLPEIESKVFNLNIVEGYSHSEISVMLSISEANSKWLLHKARKQLRKWLSLQEISSEK